MLRKQSLQQAWMQKTEPRLLVRWGKYDSSLELTAVRPALVRANLQP
jgi:hypothetical protein